MDLGLEDYVGLLLQALSRSCNIGVVNLDIELVQSGRESLGFGRSKTEDTGLNCSVVETKRSEAV